MDDPTLQGPEIRVVREPWGDKALPLPDYATDGAAGADLRADLGGGALVLGPGERALVPTGLRMEIPPGWEVQLRPRSGFALRCGVTVLNAPGTVDCDYRGPVGVILVNLGAEAQTITHGERIAQAVVAPAPRARFHLVATLSDSGRGAGGFGSTGQD